MDTASIIKLSLILLVFVIFAILMITKKLSTLIALPMLGILIPVIAGVPFFEGEKSIASFVIGQGSIRLGSTIIVTIYGSVFAQVIKKQGISDAIIKAAAEHSGDSKFGLVFILSLAAILISSAISGAGPVIMISSIVIPLMISAGVSPITASGTLLLAIGTGGMFNVGGYQFYKDTIGMDMEIIKQSSVIIGGILFLTMLIYIIINLRFAPKSKNWAKPDKKTTRERINPLAILAPLLPIILVFAFKMEVNTALLISIVYTALIKNPKRCLHTISASFIEGIKDIAGVIALMIGIGILLNGVTAEQTANLMQPLISAILPTAKWSFVLVFTICAPLALYRGPLNMFGLGSGIAGIMKAAGVLSPSAVGYALRAVGLISVGDPTYSQNIIVAEYAKVDVTEILRSLFPYLMCATFVSLVYTAAFVL